MKLIFSLLCFCARNHKWNTVGQLEQRDVDFTMLPYAVAKIEVSFFEDIEKLKKCMIKEGKIILAVACG